MDVTDLRIALFSGNYNYTRDGANQALNRLAGFLLRQGAALRVYAPVVAEPDFPATGDLVDIPNVRMPVKGRANTACHVYESRDKHTAGIPSLAEDRGKAHGMPRARRVAPFCCTARAPEFCTSSRTP